MQKKKFGKGRNIMTDKKPGLSSVKIKQSRHETVFHWLRSAAFKCILMDIVAFFLILILFFVVCVPKKYTLSVGTISHDTIIATKDVIDEVSTQEKKNAAAALVDPTYRFQQDVKEEVMSSLGDSFNELHAIQQFGMSLRTESPSRPNSFSEEEIAYAIGLLDQFNLNRNQIVTLLRTDNEQFEEMVTAVTSTVENTMNSTVREDNINDAIQSILLFAGIKVDISLIQNIVPTVLRACIKPNMIIDQEATDEARTTAMETVEPVLVVQGESIVREGDRITRNQLEMLRQLGMLNDDTLDYSSYWGSVISVLLSMMML